jgi:hypothetical protein
MDMYSLYKQVKFDTTQNLYNLFDPTFRFDSTGIEMGSYTITREDEMRIDLIYQNMYQISSITMDYENIDVILYINNILNPLNLKQGMVLIYPQSLENISLFRYTPTSTVASTDVIRQLGTLNVPNKTTRQDPSRQNFVESDYSLPPVVLDTPREPVRIENGMFSIGGL